MENSHYSDLELDEIKLIQKKYSIEPERFVKGLTFAELVADGKAANEAYQSAFFVSSAEAAKNSSNLKRAKWIQELVKYLLPDAAVEFTEVRRTIISKNMRTIKNSNEPQEISAATNALAKFVLAPVESNTDNKENASSAAMIVSTLVDKMAELAGQNKMISPTGEIVDVAVME